MPEISRAEFDQARRSADRGDVEQQRRLVETRPALRASRNDDKTPPTFDRSIRLNAASWPAGRPNGAVTIKLHSEFNADPALRFQGAGETVSRRSASIETEVDTVETLLGCDAQVNARGGAFVDSTVSAAGWGRVDFF